jgi:hypothetical protein
MMVMCYAVDDPLSMFRHEDRPPITGSRFVHFTRNGFGGYTLDRKRVLDQVMKNIESQLALEPWNSTHVYLSGCRGMGKTNSLLLLARHLKAQGWEVFSFDSAAAIPQGIGTKFISYARKKMDKRIAVFVDEVGSNPDSDLFTALLKDAPPNILTVGAAVPKYPPTRAAHTFRTILDASDLVLRRDAGDVIKLIEHWKSIADDIEPAMIDFVSEFLLTYCGGHVYPVLAFMEYFFTDGEARKFLADEHSFCSYFSSPAFAETAVYRVICQRCFEDCSIETGSADALARLLSGVEDTTDVSLAVRLGWWNREKATILSALLMRECLAQVQVAPCDGYELPICLNKEDSSEKNIEKLIVEGLFAMKPCELSLVGSRSGWLAVNALAFSWLCHVNRRFINMHMEFQEPNGRSLFDFYVDGSVNCSIEVLHNGTRTFSHAACGGSQDIDKHFERLLSGADNDPKERPLALLNFAMGGQVVLPKKVEYHQQVYTYDHTNNTLFRGSECIRAPAVAGLPCSAPLLRAADIGAMVETTLKAPMKMTKVTSGTSATSATKCSNGRGSSLRNRGGGTQRSYCTWNVIASSRALQTTSNARSTIRLACRTAAPVTVSRRFINCMVAFMKKV